MFHCHTLEHVCGGIFKRNQRQLALTCAKYASQGGDERMIKMMTGLTGSSLGSHEGLMGLVNVTKGLQQGQGDDPTIDPWL